MLAQFLIGVLLAVLAIDRFHKIVALFPWLFDHLYYLIFPKCNTSTTINEAYQPSVNEDTDSIEVEKVISIPDNIDDSLTQLLETLYDIYVDMISNILGLSQDVHKTFRALVRYFFSDFCFRISKVDVETLILGTVVPRITAHLSACQTALDSCGEAEKDLIHKAYNQDEIHSAIIFDGSEEECYLKNLFESVLHLSLPETQQNSRFLLLLLRSVLAFNVFKPLVVYLSEPNNIRYLIVTSFNAESSGSGKGFTKLVPILKQFASQTPSKYTKITIPPKNFMLSWDQLQSNPSLLYVCLQVLKNNDRFVFPQLCMTLDEWKSKISRLEPLSPSAKAVQTQSLLIEAHKIYKVFIAPESVHRIKFPREIVHKCSQIDFSDQSEEGMHKIEIIFSLAYKSAYEVLTSECLDYFYRSPRFFMLCFGERPKVDDKLSTFHLLQSRKEFGVLATTGEKTNLEMSPLDQGLNYNPSLISSDDEPLSDCASVESQYGEQPFTLDLSKLKVEITDLRTSWKKGGKIFLFVITVHSSQSKEMQGTWEVARQHKEFYGLENRLKRFHGARVSQFLPPRKALRIYKDYKFLKSCIKPFQEYLETILQNAYLKCSSMVYAFLTQETTIGSTSFFSKGFTIDTGRAIQSVLDTLTTERGKYIDGFINSFAASTEIYRPKTSARGNSLQKLKKKLGFLKDPYVPASSISELHWYETKTSRNSLVRNLLRTFVLVTHPNSFYTTILHFFYTMFGGISELFFRRWVSDRLKEFVSPSSISSYILGIRNLLIEPLNYPDVSREEFVEKVANQVPNSMNICYRTGSFCLLSNQDIRSCAHSFCDLFDNVDMNKQILYSLLDDIFASIYPELTHTNTNKHSSSYSKFTTVSP